MEEQQVRDAIRSLIEKREKRIDQVERAGDDKGLVTSLKSSISTLIELQHNLRLCGCPDEAYSEKGQP